ncbi:MAG: hypothetical protein PHF86_10670 [Candidatus Nanoarchaeia archaeon]|nr:hypothetical protein [Candidatus Nanoarchaeia archaeon]
MNDFNDIFKHMSNNIKDRFLGISTYKGQDKRYKIFVKASTVEETSLIFTYKNIKYYAYIDHQNGKKYFYLEQIKGSSTIKQGIELK